MSDKIERLQRYSTDGEREEFGFMVLATAAAARERVLVEALGAFVGTGDYSNANAGWRGIYPPSPEMFQCEYCKESHYDFTLIEHAVDCIIKRARRVIAEIEEAPDGD